ncbi:MAG: hypothetical protein J5594_00215 [Elusimicrobiaceae bacterium]|nr:hypothetical protein [Elusimicrobiaceae bacterium]
MLILWRAFLIAVCCFAVIICYPNYANGALTVIFTWAVVAFFIMLILTLITKAIQLGKSHIFNSFFDIALVIGFLYILLNILPLSDGTTPFIRIKKNVYPTKQDISKGLENLGFTKKEENLGKLQKNIDEISIDIDKVKTLIFKEHKD